ncbi:hypothetical protein J2W83_002659 [Pseudomonas hunanensis]|uniref:Uncharacterized protein n=1 Tax=Pseudomonas hunanensis TaxID=1247546 RepID=A0ACC6K3U1_9PSED|nr:hypothetical protein [Pseudomonas hunanensis]MDR6713057.1 hypothetical protein [Pseudomonas hunanensis]
MFNLMKAPELPPQLQWKHANEPEVLAWEIRARNYNTFIANAMFVFCFSIIVAVSIYQYLDMRDDPVFAGVMALMLFIVVTVALFSVTHQRMNYAYRITRLGVEYCKWKDFPKWALVTVKWITGISAILFIFMATIDPTFLIGALVGPGGMGLTYMVMANSKSYRDLHTSYHNNFYKWSELTKATIATNRDMVEVDYSVPKTGSVFKITGSLYVFFKRKNKQHVVEVFKKHLPSDVLAVVGKVDVLHY